MFLGGEVYGVSPLGADRLIGKGWDGHFYVYSISTGKIEPWNELQRFDTILQSDPERNLLYYETRFVSEGGSKESIDALMARVREAFDKNTMRQTMAIQTMEKLAGIAVDKHFLYRLDMAKGVRKKIGVFPGKILIEEGTLLWSLDRTQDLNNHDQFFGFENLETGAVYACSDNTCGNFILTQSDLVFSRAMEVGRVWYRAGRRTGNVVEMMRGDYKPVLELSYRPHVQNSWAYLKGGETLIGLDPMSGDRVNLGSWDFLAEWAPGTVLLIRKNKDHLIRIAFWREGTIVQEEATPFQNITVLDKRAGKRILLGTLSGGGQWECYLIEEDTRFQMRRLPNKTIAGQFFSSPDRLLLWRGEPRWIGSKQVPYKTYIYDVPTGKMRRL